MRYIFGLVFCSLFLSVQSMNTSFATNERSALIRVQSSYISSGPMILTMNNRIVQRGIDECWTGCLIGSCNVIGPIPIGFVAMKYLGAWGLLIGGATAIPCAISASICCACGTMHCYEGCKVSNS